MIEQETCPQDAVLIGVSGAMRKVVSLIDAVAMSDCCVLIEGETGTGKDLAARRLHAKSRRAAGPFVPVNCAGVTDTLFESQFFGHVRGAFTGAEQSMMGLVRSADAGTLFLDEIVEVPLNLQAKLLRVLQDGEVRPVGAVSPTAVQTRFIAATNLDLAEETREGRFRKDLYYRLNVVRIYMPPLRSHPEDVPILLDHFLAKSAERHERSPVPVDANVREELAAYCWPGNVRELMSWVDRLYATRLSPEVLAASLLAEAEATGLAGPMGLPSLKDAERSAIARTLNACEHNRTMAAQVLGINRGSLLRKIAQYELV